MILKGNFKWSNGQPQLKYTRVLPESQDDDDDEGEGPGLPKKKKKPKTGKRGARKRAEAEAKAAEAENGEAPSQEALFKKANDAKNEAKLKEIQEVQRQDRMAQVNQNSGVMDSWFRKMSIFTFRVKAEDAAKERKEDPEKEARTVFVGNLPVSCKKQELKKIFGEYGKIEAVRFRCAARPDLKTTKKV